MEITQKCLQGLPFSISTTIFLWDSFYIYIIYIRVTKISWQGETVDQCWKFLLSKVWLILTSVYSSSMFVLNGGMNSPSADVSFQTITLVRTEHMVEQCFSKLGSAGKDWPLHAVDFVYGWGREEEEKEKSSVNNLTICRSVCLQKHKIFASDTCSCLDYPGDKSVAGMKKGIELEKCNLIKEELNK